MFTGLVQEVGTVEKAERRGQDLWLTVRAPNLAAQARIGDSIAVNGCCLTAVECAAPRLSFQAVPETLARTALGMLREKHPVNLEPALAADGRFGGHFVQGHVDGLAEVLGLSPEGAGLRMRIRVPEKISRYVIEKGSIALDGVSLTVAAMEDRELEVALIPHTLEGTNLRFRKPGDLLQVEVDLLAKYSEKLLAAYLRARVGQP